MKKAGLIVFFVTLVLLLSKCQPEPKTTIDNGFSTTPFPFEVPLGFPKPNIPADNPMTVEGVTLGRYLFFDENLSKDRSMSCASCHLNSHFFSDPNEKSIGVHGGETRRHSIPLFNLAWQEKFFWDGRASSLEEQALIPVTDPIELDSDWETVLNRIATDPVYDSLFLKAFNTSEVTPQLIGKAIAQYERTMVSANSKYDSVIRLGLKDWDNQSLRNGYATFASDLSGNCLHCHGENETSFLLGSFGDDLSFMNNGSVDNNTTDLGRKEVTGIASDFGKFKVPSLRNVAFTKPYFHDGSIPDLDSLVEFYNIGGQDNDYISALMRESHVTFPRFTEKEKEDLILFLRSLTDFSFLKDTLFTDPRH